MESDSQHYQTSSDMSYSYGHVPSLNELYPMYEDECPIYTDNQFFFGGPDWWGQGRGMKQFPFVVTRSLDVSS